MKIAEQFEQFNQGTALVIVTGNQDMRMYIANDGRIERILSIKIEKPAYSDREGFYKNRNGNGIRSGSVLRPVERSIRREFKQKLEQHLKDIAHLYQIKEIILFAPKRNQNETTDLVSDVLKQKITAIISGNYFDVEPFELIKKYTEATKKEKIIPTKESAKKILDKASSSKEIMRNPKKRVNGAKA